MTGTIALTQTTTAATITIGHPAANALPLALLHQLCDQLASLKDKKDLRVVLIQTEGSGAF